MNGRLIKTTGGYIVTKPKAQSEIVNQTYSLGNINKGGVNPPFVEHSVYSRSADVSEHIRPCRGSRSPTSFLFTNLRWILK